MHSNLNLTYKINASNPNLVACISKHYMDHDSVPVVLVHYDFMNHYHSIFIFISIFIDSKPIWWKRTIGEEP